MRFASLGSGSRGNATLVEHGGTRLLIDCGFSLRQTQRRLERLGIEPGQIDAILVTHEHSDHSSGVGRLSRKYSIPVFMTHGTWSSGRCTDVASVEFICSEAGFHLGEIAVMPVAVPHDAREPCQFVLQGGERCVGILTDLGRITPFVSDHYRNCHALLLECNHDPALLRDGAYPEALKRRVGGQWGHLSNQQAADFLCQEPRPGLQQLVVAHISEKNNERRLVAEVLDEAGHGGDAVVWADQETGFDWLKV